MYSQSSSSVCESFGVMVSIDRPVSRDSSLGLDARSTAAREDVSMASDSLDGLVEEGWESGGSSEMMEDESEAAG